MLLVQNKSSMWSVNQTTNQICKFSILIIPCDRERLFPIRCYRIWWLSNKHRVLIMKRWQIGTEKEMTSDSAIGLERIVRSYTMEDVWKNQHPAGFEPLRPSAAGSSSAVVRSYITANVLYYIRRMIGRLTADKLLILYSMARPAAAAAAAVCCLHKPLKTGRDMNPLDKQLEHSTTLASAADANRCLLYTLDQGAFGASNSTLFRLVFASVTD